MSKPMTPARLEEIRVNYNNGTGLAWWDSRDLLVEVERLRTTNADMLALLEECYDALPLGDLTDRIAKTLCKAKGN